MPSGGGVCSGRALLRLNPLPPGGEPADGSAEFGMQMPADVATDGTGVAGRERMPILFAGNGAAT
jgi:hypothetical protein